MSEAKVIIDLCSSDEEEEVYSDENNYEDIDETEEEEEDDSSLSEDDSDLSYDDAQDSDVVSDVEEEIGEIADDDDDKVTSLLTAGSDLKALKLNECKSYLRKHGLRLSGTKAVCIERIVNHWRIKDGSGEAVYPRSSFAINCKGDVCKGDFVMFTQKVHEKFEKMKRSGKIIGKRTVAGHVIKESYGTAKQQHTFTIEVLWCEGIQKLRPLYPLLVKGRNLYRLMTLRQRWPNEEDRVKVLSEKHSRGAAARKIMRERKIKLGYVLKDGRLQKPGHVKKPFQVMTSKNKKDENPNQYPSQGHKNPTQLRNTNPSVHPNTSHSHAPRPYVAPPRGPLPYGPFNGPHSYPNIRPSHSYAYQPQQNQRPPPVFYNIRPASNALQGQASFNPHARPATHQRRPYQNHHTNHASSNNGYNYGVRELDHFSNMMISQRAVDAYRQSEATRGPYLNHYTHRPNYNSGYNYGARDRAERGHMQSNRPYLR